MEEIPPQMRQQLAQFQQMQQQAQAISTQRSQTELELREVERTLEVVKDLGKDAELYRSTGMILIKSTKEKTEEELAEKKETLELRIKTLKKQEDRLQGKLKDIQEELRKALGPPGTGIGAGGMGMKMG